MPFPYKDLREFIKDLESKDELIRISQEVDPDLEITEISDRVSKSIGMHNKALLFENVKGYDMPVLINSMGSDQRMQMALGVDNDMRGYDAIADRIKEFIKPEVPLSAADKIKKLFELAQVKNFLPKTVTSAPCQEEIFYSPEYLANLDEKDRKKINQSEDIKLLDKLPIIKCWPDDGGPFITLTCVFTKDPDKLGAGRNVGMYRLQKFDNVTTGMHWHKHHDGAENYRKSLKNGNKMEIAVAIGCDPAVMYSATAPLPPGIDEMIMAGFIRNKPVELVKCKTIDIEVPANAEIILEGYIDLTEPLITEGPFGDHTGFYSLADKYPKFHITAITHRSKPIYATTIVGIPPQEDCYLGKATERIFLPLLQLICPEVVDMNLPWDGVFHNCALISIDKKYPGHAQKVMNTIWGTGQMAWTKYIIVLDKEVNVHDYHQVAMHAFGNTDPQRDMIFTKGPLDILDHAAQICGFGSKAGLDATRKWADEGFSRQWPDLITMSEEVKKKVDENWDNYFADSNGSLKKPKSKLLKSTLAESKSD